MPLCDKVVMASRRCGCHFHRSTGGKESETAGASLQRDLMANDRKDDFVLGHIDGLVNEEERLYAKQEFSDEDRGRLENIKIELDSIGTCFANAGLYASLGAIRIKRRSAHRTSSKTTNSNCSGLRSGFIVLSAGPRAPVPRGSHTDNVASWEIRERDSARALQISGPQL
jgi:hypothetical protein